MKRHLCTKCRKKRLEKFLKPIRNSDSPGSKVWICKDGCLDGRMNKSALSFLQDKMSGVAVKQSSLQKGLSCRSIGQSKQDLDLASAPGRKYILDVCCGDRSFWFNKNHENVIYADIKSDAKVDIVQDFRDIKYKDKSFKLVVFDPPHLFEKYGTYSWLNKKYGTLSNEEWPQDLLEGFKECFRVLDDFGILVFKWSEGDISVSTILSICPMRPLFGHTSDKKDRTHWICFMKIPRKGFDAEMVKNFWRDKHE